jgi:hypothetical protein
MKPMWQVHICRALSSLRRKLVAPGQSNYRCITVKMPLPESKADKTGCTLVVAADDDQAVDYDVPAFLRKANRKPDEPWPNFPQRETNRHDENDRFIFVPLPDGGMHIVSIPQSAPRWDRGYVW